MELTEQERATVLAALRYFQQHTSGTVRVDVMPDHFADEKPLSNKQIDKLCEKINQ